LTSGGSALRSIQSRLPIVLAARTVDKNRKTVASPLLEESEGLDKVEPPEAVEALCAAFSRFAGSMIAWTVQAF
jgi:phospholipid/cholesterol/gamma-HCH transport system substrate-binding protein